MSCSKGMHDVFFRGERLLVKDGTVQSLAEEILRLREGHPTCSRCHLPMVRSLEEGWDVESCPGVCDVQTSMDPTAPAVSVTEATGEEASGSTKTLEWHEDHAASGRRVRAWPDEVQGWELIVYEGGRWEVRGPPSGATMAFGEEFHAAVARLRVVEVFLSMTKEIRL